MPFGRFCAAMQTWMLCIQENNAGLQPDKYRHGSTYHEHLQHIYIDIRKSNLLARLLFGGEKLRTKKCPIHQGHWSGAGRCEYHCEMTGFLPEP